MTDEAFQSAMDQAYRFLAQRFLSTYELRQKMRRKSIPADMIDRVEERLIYFDYLNDERLSHQVASYLMNEGKYGIYLIKQKMKLRGLTAPPEIDGYDELGAAFRVVEKRYGTALEESAVPRQKLMRFLRSRGFDMGTIRAVCNEFYSAQQ